jgi:glycosyltransferase involved in cell wall biosynthesis
MRVLWMKPILPFPPNQGTRRVTLQLLRHLAPHHEVRLFARRLSRSEDAQVDALRLAVPDLEVVAPLAPNRRSLAHRAWYRVCLQRPGAALPPIEAYTALPELRRRFAEECRRFEPELVVVEYWYAASYLEVARGVPRVLFAHDIESRARARATSFHQEPGRRPRWSALEARREGEALGGAPATWFLTDADRDEAVSTFALDPERAGIVPYGLDLDGELAAPGEADPPEDPESVVLFGSYAADFNRDALGFTLREVWPLLQRRRPAARLIVAGGGLPADLAERARAAGAIVRGEVRDVRRLLLEAAVALVPLRYGGGLRIRLLESLALERAVVGTPVGVLGMGPRRDREVTVGETGEELAERIAELLADPERRRKLGAAGRSWVREHHGMSAAAERQRALVLHTASLGGPW